MQTFRNQFLIAMPQMQDPNFAGTLTYICEHSEKGAMGIVINRPLEMSLGEILSQLDLGGDELDIPVYSGGPVQLDRGFVLHNGAEWTSSLTIADGILLTTSKDILAAIASENGPEDYLVALGYAGWGEGQLEQEIADNAWLVCPASTDVLFHMPFHKRFNAALASMGIDLAQLSGQVGHS
ncbi:MAG: YqgE/AlgH family protein [Hahellaceae bacterium]|nr:YqgE/AlgH family protein [Hahellaceae bacterium]MCP5169318.1 YqgE/AlgH family protein [Hahellaceae bacterium]